MFQKEKIIEEYIANNEVLKEHKYLGMCIMDATYGKEIYRSLSNNLMSENYFIFGSNGGGQTEFALYKSNTTNNIYIFVLNYGDIYSYEFVENEHWFDKYIA